MVLMLIVGGVGVYNMVRVNVSIEEIVMSWLFSVKVFGDMCVVVN